MEREEKKQCEALQKKERKSESRGAKLRANTTDQYREENKGEKRIKVFAKLFSKSLWVKGETL
ncbi:MAG: hypothetical protein Q4C42_10840, partial [Clostridia bacterium]|nr:hypothetical protein [Clostridia bacterium]